jgi:C-terminal processing protease CtpA/Prc
MAAQAAGIEAGDAITAVDGMETADMSLRDFVGLVRGDDGATVELEVSGIAGVRTVELVRERLIVPREGTDWIRDLARQREFGGVGMGLRWDDGVFVSQVTEGLPAAAAGARVGDRIVVVDGVDASSTCLWCVIDLIRGEAGAEAVVEVIGSDGERRRLEMVRETIVRSERSCR